jgi:hypothetical protein
MDAIVLNDILNKANQRQTQLLFQRGADYASNSDILGNFKRVAEICAILNVDIGSPLGCSVYMMVHKLDRLCNMHFGEERPPTLTWYDDKGNEMFLSCDSLDDLRNYTILAEAIIREGFN